MGLVIKGTEPGQSGLGILISSDAGLPINGVTVTYSIYDQVGKLISGRNLPALPSGPGKYRGTWIANVPNGAYVVEWSINSGSGGAFTRKENIFVVDKYSYVCSTLNAPYVKSSLVPPSGSRAYLSGTQLKPEDLYIIFKDYMGNLIDPYSVEWTIYNSKGCIVAGKKSASRKTLGYYWADCFISGASGDYFIEWQFQETSTTPLVAPRYGFSLICPCNPLPCQCKS